MNDKTKRKLVSYLQELNGKKVTLLKNTWVYPIDGILEYNGEKVYLNDGLFRYAIDIDTIMTLKKAEESKIKRYVKKPVEIEAIEYTGSNTYDIVKFVGYNRMKIYRDSIGQAQGLAIVTLEGTMSVMEGDYIIRGIKGECYPCKPDIFNATYEVIDEE